MSIMNLDVSSFPYSVNKKAGIVLMVLVTDETGKARSGLRTNNFKVRWIDNVKIEHEAKRVAFAEYTSAKKLPEIPGVYMIQIMSKHASWSQVATFHIAVDEKKGRDHDQGQTLYRIDDSSFRQMTSGL